MSLHEHVVARRTELRISQSEAARRAGVGRMSWWEWEKGRRQPYDYNFSGIETALEWDAGSVRAILAGREPTIKPAEAPKGPAVGSDEWWLNLARELPEDMFWEVVEHAKENRRELARRLKRLVGSTTQRDNASETEAITPSE